ncbi:MAG: hypothetical protein RIE53_10970 [Rhodothermales bacterium]
MMRRLQTKKLCRLTLGWMRRAPGLVAVLFAVAAFGCDAGLEPPPEPGFGRLEVHVAYTGEWPPAQELRDLRFVALRFVPRDTTDLLQLNRMVISGRLDRNVPADTIALDMVPEGTYVYAGVAQQFSADLFAWRPVGLVDGAFDVLPGAVTRVTTHVDFGSLPPFPPPQP